MTDIYPMTKQDAIARLDRVILELALVIANGTPERNDIRHEHTRLLGAARTIVFEVSAMLDTET